MNGAKEAVSCTEHYTEAHDPEGRCSDTEIHKVFHNDISCIFCSGETRLYHSKPGLHKKTNAAPTSTQIVLTDENSIIKLPFP